MSVGLLDVTLSKRQWLNVLVIRAVDMFVYALVAIAGITSMVLPTPIMSDSLANYTWLVSLWSWLLLLGGLTGLLGRITGYWMVEAPATIAVATGIIVYTVILLPEAFENVTMLIATALSIVASTLMVRRWLELQIFATEPDAASRLRFRTVAA